MMMDMSAVLGYFALRRELDRTVRGWRAASSAGARRSSRLTRRPAAGTVIEPRTPHVEQLEWRRRIEIASRQKGIGDNCVVASRGVVLDRGMLETIALFGGSRRWNAETKLSLRFLTFDEIERFLRSGGGEPYRDPQRFDVEPDPRDSVESFVPLRDGGEFDNHWDPGWHFNSMVLNEDASDGIRWIPIADIAYNCFGKIPRSRPRLLHIQSMQMMLVFQYNLEVEYPYQHMGFVTAFGEDLYYHAAPYRTFGHLLREAINITHDPETFLDCTLWESDEDSSSEDDEDSDASGFYSDADARAFVDP